MAEQTMKRRGKTEGEEGKNIGGRKERPATAAGKEARDGFALAQRFVEKVLINLLSSYFAIYYGLLDAIALANLQNGLTCVLVPAMFYISENHVSHLKVILYSTAANTIGMVMLCFSHFQWISNDKIGIYFIVLLMTVGNSGGLPISREFIYRQLTAHEPRLDIDEDRVNARTTVWWATLFLSSILTPLIFGNATWDVRIIFSTSMMGIGYLLFLCCIPLYHRSVDEATTTKISHAGPEEKKNNGPAAFAISLVKQWKPLSVMIPMWTTFLVFGLGIMVTIWTAMVLSIFCCSVAWRVEAHRLHAIMAISKDESCINQNDRPMSIMWLAPQFCLLGLMDGIGRQGLDLLFEVQVSDVQLEKYGSVLNNAVIGIGSFLNGLLVVLLRSWFSDGLNCNRLDKYYLTLMVVSLVNLCCYCCISTFYLNKKETKDDVKVEETGGSAV
ncbi:hypothetical protein Vadar_018004 [Vaccinium darrowii]|uniref:Uncharacterized protein n=1 Tax=Vaccinium darrowii TaxID=229202 RepID=A0ACB7XZR9_9ERIC|nr:hypothetical protein Vadar_018004 [Vaccinium darrowii]